ncbi:putative bacteriophage protein [Xenorhabdus bovienii str. feltiae Moldova]|uniref:Putative bacteriophage protein n=2 Tax=Xenorhabdus bovienii TaxID=40576 RepID=A0A077NT57_XENBV|nr:putative bacteriophage protein [Xenorhabdus bovienii str. feltiae Moldova]
MYINRLGLVFLSGDVAMKFSSQHFTLGALVIVSGLLWFYYSEYREKAKAYTELDTKYKNQQAITDNAFQSIRIINDISRINSESRDRSAVDSEQTKTVIKTVVANHDCANRLVPDGAVIRLQQHTNRIRSGATDTHSGTPAR